MEGANRAGRGTQGAPCQLSRAARARRRCGTIIQATASLSQIPQVEPEILDGPCRKGEVDVTKLRLSLEALEVLDAIARRGSFAAAAEALQRVPSAITYTIHKLETDLQVQLFDRNGHRAKPTEAGVSLMREASQLLSTLSDVEQRTQRIAQGLEAELRVVHEALIPFERLLPLIQRFNEEVPGVRLSVMTEALTGCWDALRRGRADLAIGAPEYSMPSGVMNVKHLGDVHWQFYVAPDHPLTRCEMPAPSTEIEKYRTVLIADSARDLPTRSMGLRAGADALTVSSNEAKAAAQAAGIGVGFLSPQTARQWLADKRLVVIDVEEPRPPSRLCYAWQSRQTGPGLSWFLRQLESPAVREALLG